MSIPGAANPLLLATAAAGGYSISRSVRFNSSDSAYLSRTPASAGNRKTWTWAGWVKRSDLSASFRQLFTAADNNYAQNGFDDLGRLRHYPLNNGNAAIRTVALFRDPSAWYHIVFYTDTTNATASDRLRIYVNGVRQDVTGTFPSQNLDLSFNQAIAHNIGRYHTGSEYFSGYLADIHFIDGQALDPTSFGEFSATTGVWMPKAYTGTYGTNGFRLNFADNSAATATTLGKDAAGSNNWTPNNLSVTAGAGNDSLVDVPTNGSEVDTGSGGQVRGNYCTLNPLDKSSSVDLSNGNLTNVGTTTNVMCRSTIFVSSGKWYYEVTLATYSGNPIFGWASSSANLASWVGNSTSSWGYAANAMKYSNGGGSSYGASFGAGDVVGVAADLDAGTLVFYKNGVSQGTAYSNLSGALCPAFSSGASTTVDFNFGQRPFAYTAPSGYKALCTANLPAPVVTKPSDLFDVKLYTGNGSTQTISGLGFSPDFLWFKVRNNTSHHTLYDVIRGATKSLNSSNTNAEATEGGGLSSFTSDGFSLSGDNTVQGSTNASGGTYVAWAWDAGSSTVTNTAGSISSQVRTNNYLSIVTYTGTGANATVGHGLGVAPQMIIVKSRGSVTNWGVGHTSIGWANALRLNTTDASSAQATFWNSTAPTSTVFSVGTGPSTNNNGDSIVAYCFAPVAGYASMGSFVANANSDGPFVYTSFKPRLVLCKLSSASGADWLIFDTARSPYNVVQANLRPNTSGAEESAFARIDILSNGFKVRAGSGVEPNGTNGNTYIYAAWAESPFNYSRAA